MMTYKDGVLRFRKIDAPDIPISAVTDIQDSYTTYVTQTIYEDMEYLQELLQKISGLHGVVLKTKIGDIVEHNVPTLSHVGVNRYIPVSVDIYLPGSNDPVKRDTDIVRIPAMHDFGKFNFEGNLKVIVSQLRATDAVSYESGKKTMNITMPRVNLRIRICGRSISFISRQKQIPVLPVLVTMLADAGDTTPIQDYIKSVRTLSLLGYKEGMRTEHYVDSTRLHGGIYKSLQNDAYTLGDARVALNDVLRLERGMGEQLAEPCNGYPRGYNVDQKFIDDAYKARINQYVIRNRSFQPGYFYAGAYPIVLSELPRGMKNTSYLRQLLPEYREYRYFEENVTLGDPIIIDKWHLLSADEMELIYSCGYTSIPISSKKNGTIFIYSFVHEIIGNYTAPLYKLVDTVPEGRNADEWIYYYNNPDLEAMDTCASKLTAHDLLAVVSILGDISVSGNTDLLNRDTSFLKKVAMVNELFSESLRATMREYVTMSKIRISNYVMGSSADLDNVSPFIGMTKKWYSTMVKRKITATVDAMNLSAEIAQSCHITTPDNGSGEILDEQRDIAIPFYGRLCPFETPAGFKLGTVNTRALGSRIVNGILQSPYRKVIGAGDSFRISNNITWLSPSQELGHRFASTLSLIKRADGLYENNKILARVPNTDRSDEPFTFKNIHAKEMIGHYVDAFPEQSISPATALVPFACCNNSIRLSYGISQIKQGVLLPNSQKPRVCTPMHSQIFNFYGNIPFVAPCNGKVVNIVLDNYIEIESSKDGSVHTVHTTNVNQSSSRPMLLTYYVKVGDAVTESQEICRGVIHPTDFVVRSPMTGYITSISRSSIEIMKNNSQPTAGRFVDIRNEEVTVIPLNPFRKFGTNAVYLNIRTYVGQYVKEGDILADTYTSREGLYTPARCPLVAFVPTGHNYEDGIHATERASVGYVSMLATTLKHLESTGKAHSMSLSIPSDFSYHSAGSIVTTVKKFSAGSKEPRKSNIIATAKSHGFYYEGHMINSSSESRKEYALSMLSFNKLQKGDKMSGMHGNKGTVSIVQPDGEAMQLANGMTCEILLSPCGVPSRMNYGQMMEMPLSLCAEVLNIQAETPAYNGATLNEVRMLMKFVYELCNKVNTMGEVASLFTKYPEVPSELYTKVQEEWAKIKDWEGVFDDKGRASIYDPTIDKWLANKAVIGFPTFNKLMQEAEEKLNVRAGLMEEEYARTTSQPIGNINSAKGQRMGEMELVDIINYGMSSYLEEVLNEASDNTNLRTNYLLQLMGDDSITFPKQECVPRATNNLMHLLHSVGVWVDFTDDEINYTDARRCMDYEELNLQKYLRNKFKGPVHNPLNTTQSKDIIAAAMREFGDD